jgi:hypothetical protein
MEPLIIGLDSLNDKRAYEPKGQDPLTEHDQFKGLDQNVRSNGGQTEAIHTCLAPQPDEAEVKLIRQGHNASLWRLLSHLPHDLKGSTGGLAGVDEDKGRP